jgi:eukaryotic-like serine/threonine-protein kinase
VSVGRDFNLVLPSPEVPDSDDVPATLTGLLARVRAMWITGLLEQATSARVPFVFTGNGGRGRGLHPDVGEAAAIQGDALATTFESHGRALLILGEAGTGKTVALLTLTEALVNRAETDPGEPVPVVFQLASWPGGRKSLADWLIEQLVDVYKMPARAAKHWLERHRILLMLDGLDEVPAEKRVDCVEAINEFVRDGSPGLAVTCRLKAYEALGRTLAVNCAICLRPLSREQVLDYVSNEGDALSSLRAALHSDASLLELARTPLMLNIMTRAYRGLSTSDLIRDGLDEPHRRAQHVFDTFVHRAMTAARTDTDGKGLPPDEIVIAGMAWLAQRGRRMQMLQIDRLQPTWLDGTQSRVTYLAMSRVLAGGVLGLLAGIAGLAGLAIAGGLLPSAEEALITLLFGLVPGLAGGTVAAAIDIVRLTTSKNGNRHVPFRVAYSVILSVALASAGTAAFAMTSGAGFAIYGAGFGLVWAAVLYLFLGPRRRSTLDSDIAPVETLRFDTARAGRAATRAAIAGIAIGLAVGISAMIDDQADTVVASIAALIAGLGLGLVGIVVGGAVGGLRRGEVAFRTRVNEGLYLTARNMLIGSGVVGAASCVVLAPLSGLLIGAAWGWLLGLAAAACVALMAGFWFGGVELLRHAVLRVLIGRSNPSLPLPRLLEVGEKVGFLQRAGGAFLFIHSRLEDYFRETKFADGNRNAWIG